MGLTNEHTDKCPEALRCPVGSLWMRHKYVHRLGKAQYCEEVHGYVSLADLIYPNARYLVNVADTHLPDYDRFMKFS